MSNFYYIQDWQKPTLGSRLTDGGPDLTPGAPQPYKLKQPQLSGGPYTQIDQASQTVQPIVGKSNTAGAVAAGAYGALQIGNNIGQAIGQADSINTQVPGSYAMDQYGTPAYTLGQAQQQAAGFNRNDYGKGLVGSSAGTGAATGAAIGAPLGGVGGIIGGAIGGIIGGISGAFGQGAARNRAARRNRQLQSNISAAQDRYNKQNIIANQNYLSRQEYEDLLNRPSYVPQNYYWWKN